MNKYEAIKYGEQTMEIIKRGEYQLHNGKTVSILKELNDSIMYATLYRPEELDSLLKQESYKPNVQTIIEVTGETTLEASKRLVNEGFTQVACLNFASAKRPGGGFLTGSRAQEESIARSSGLYPTIAQMNEMYEYNKGRKTGMYSDYMIFSPNVPVFRNDKGDLLETPYLLSVITSPAVNANVVKEREPNQVKDINKVMLLRIKKILAVAKAKNQTSLVLGAFGCGVFGNNAVAIGKLFRLALEDKQFKNQFQKIVFAIYEGTSQKPMLQTFKQTFGKR
jgi:uncharacterized protein (TIGR02452 family)